MKPSQRAFVFFLAVNLIMPTGTATVVAQGGPKQEESGDLTRLREENAKLRRNVEALSVLAESHQAAFEALQERYFKEHSIGISRDKFTETFGKLGYEFTEGKKNAEGEAQFIARKREDGTVILLVGRKENLTKAELLVPKDPKDAELTKTADKVILITTFLEMFDPSWSKENAWAWLGLSLEATGQGLDVTIKRKGTARLFLMQHKSVGSPSSFIFSIRP